MFKRGQGVSNKGLKYSAEKAAHALKCGILKSRWDQLLCCSITKVKSFSGHKHREEEVENDVQCDRSDGTSNPGPRRKETVSLDARLSRAIELLDENEEFERAILAQMRVPEDSEPTVLEDATLEQFSKIRAPLLSSFTFYLAK
jgi:hypothetical protein